MAYPNQDSNSFIEYIRSTVDPTYELSKAEALKYAAKMGASDSFRGIQQFGARVLGMDEATEELKRKDRTLQQILDNEEYGSQAMAAFLGSAVVADPLGYVPIAGWISKGKKAKSIWELTKYGGMAGGFHAGMGYVSEESPGLIGEKQSRLENIAIGATAGSALGALGGATLEGIAKIRGKEGYFAKSDEFEAPRKSAEDTEETIDLTAPLKVGSKIIAPDRKNRGTIIQIDKEGFALVQFVSKDGAKATKKFPLDKLQPPKKGEALKSPEGAVAGPTIRSSEVEFAIDTKSNPLSWLYKAKNPTTKTSYVIQKAIDENGNVIPKQWEVISTPLLRGRKKGESIADFNRRKKELVQRNIFGSLQDSKKFVKNQIQPIQVQKQKDVAETLKPVNNQPVPKETEQKVIEDKVQEVFGEQADNKIKLNTGVLKFYQDNFGIALKNKVFDNWGSALTGTASGIAGYNSVDDPDATALQKFGAGFLAGMAGAGLTKTLGKLKVGDDALAEHMGRFLVDDYGLSSDYKLLRREAQVNKNQIAQQFLDLALESKEKLDGPQRKLLYNLMTGNLDAIDDLAEEGIELNLKTRKVIGDMGQKYVDLGLLDNETFLQNINTYLHRSYTRNLKAGQSSKMYTAMRQVSLIGNNLRERGITKTVSKASFDKVDSKWKAEGWEIIGEPTKAGKVKIRKDFTKDERTQMGEIEDAAFAIAETGRLMSNDIATAQFFRNLSNDSRFALTKEDWLSKGEPSDFVLVPNTTLKGTTAKSYGELAEKITIKADGTKEIRDAMYVHKDVMNDIKRMVQLTKEKETMEEVYKAFNKAQAVWKKSKTAWNPAVHTNNIMSNFVLLDFSDTSYTYLPKALKELMKGEKSELYRLAREQGVFDVDMVTKELRDTSGAMGQAFNKITAVDEPSQFYGYSTDMFKHFKKVKDLSLTKLENLYQQEDQVFRMAVFMDRMDKKMNVTEAAMNARKWFIDYDINAPVINKLRNTATPFLSYTYRIVPLLAETATLRPHKFAKWAGIGYGLNEVGKQVAGGDPDLERVTMRDEYSKTLWGVPYMPPTVLRVPWNSNDGDSQYLDVSRWIPGGDIFEERETGIPGVPAPLQPSFGLYGDIYNVAVARTDPFTGQEIDGLGVDEDGKAIAKALVKRLTPNLPIIPGSYSYDKIARSLREGKGYEKGELVPGSGYTAPYSFGESVAYSLGVKLRPQDPDVNQKSKEFQLNQDLKAADQIAREARKDFEKGNITYKEREELIKKAELRRVQVLAEWEAYTKVYNEARAKRIQRIEKERLNKFEGGEVDVPYTKDEPEDRVDSFTGKPYSDQMARLGLAEGGKILPTLIFADNNSRKLTQKEFNRMIAVNDYLKGKGYRKETRAGILGNIHIETGGSFSPTQIEQAKDKQLGYGIFQLTGKEKDFNNWMKENNFDKKTVDELPMQIEYMHETIYGNELIGKKRGREIGDPTASRLQKSFATGTPEEIALSFSNEWEKPSTPHNKQRIKAASTIFNIID